MGHLAGVAGLESGLVVVPAAGCPDAGFGWRLVIADVDQYFMVSSSALSYCSGRQKQQYCCHRFFFPVETDAKLADLLPDHHVMQCFAAAWCCAVRH